MPFNTLDSLQTKEAVRERMLIMTLITIGIVAYYFYRYGFAFGVDRYQTVFIAIIIGMSAASVYGIFMTR